MDKQGDIKRWLNLARGSFELAQMDGMPIEGQIHRNTESIGHILKALELLTTAETTTPVPTPEKSLAASYKESGMDVMIPTTQPLSQSDQAGTQSGRVEQDSKCAHPQGFKLNSVGYGENFPYEPMTAAVSCPVCLASWWFDRTPVPAATPTSSTSPKQDSKESAETSPEESVRLESRTSQGSSISLLWDMREYARALEQHRPVNAAWAQSLREQVSRLFEETSR
jgi:hypothetical protein